jgi:hypothetical protein
MRAMIERGLCLGNVQPGHGLNISISAGQTILTERNVAFDLTLLTAAKGHGCRFVHDLDDLLWAIPLDNPNVDFFTPKILETMSAHMAACDALTVSTERLASELHRRGFQAAVVPNVLDPRDWFAQPRRTSRSRLRVGWYGQHAVHVADLALLSAIVQELIDEIDFVFLGDRPAGLGDLCARIEYHAAVPLPLFPAMLAALDLDLVLAPLAHNAFNESKSSLPILQAGMLGYAVIASAIEPYYGIPVTCVPNVPALWIAAIRERAHDRSSLQCEGETLRRFVHGSLLVDAWLDRYLAIWTGSTSAKHAPEPTFV